MLIFLDTEFTKLNYPDLISLALVAEDGRVFYAERTDYNPSSCSEFVRETVLPLLGRVPGADCTNKELTERVRAWLKESPEPATIIYDHSTDWHLLGVTMLGRPHSKPPGDFATPLFLDSHTITHPMFVQTFNRVYTDDWPPHHALADARALMAGYRAWRAFMEPIWKIR